MYCGGLIVRGEGQGRFGIFAEGSSFELDGVRFLLVERRGVHEG